ncbi:MAG TPA: hypothetical protein VM055_03345 [Novosphingobium sp.]|nr:hypothetical protein [Novosphingobium sp.]
MTCHKLALIVATLLGSLAAAPGVFAQDSGAIVVEGDRQREAEIVRDLAHDLTRPPPVDKPVPKFMEPVCLGAFGIEAGYGAALVDRIADNAREVGAPVGKPGCRPNVIVAFVEDGDRAIRALKKARPGVFGDLTDYQIKQAMNEDGPVRVWTPVETRDSFGRSMALSTDEEYTTNKLISGSHIAVPVQAAMTAAVVLISRRVVPGKTIRQLADYATMRALAATRPTGEGAGSGPRTILALFDAGDAAADGLTGFDRAYLKALYTSSRGERASTLASAVASRYFSERQNKAER